MKRRIPAILLSLCMLVGLLPGTVSAVDDDSVGDGSEQNEGELFLDKWVKETEDGNFKLVLESYATGSNGTITTKPVPVDIVLVLDESGSMDDVLIRGCNDVNGTDVNVTPEGHLAAGGSLDNSEMDTVLFVGHKVFENEVNTSKTYTVVYPADGTTRKIYYCSDCSAWYSNTNHEDHKNIAKWIPFVDEDGTPTENRTGDDWTCTVQFYEECGQTGRDLLRAALTNFLGTLYDASNPDNGEAVNNRVAIVGYGQGASYINTNGTRQVVFPDTGDAPGGIPVDGYKDLAKNAWCNVANLQEGSIDQWVTGIQAEGATPTHLGIQAAELAFDNAPETEDKNRNKVMILFTDGTPGANYNNYGPGSSSLYPDWVTPGIQSAKAMKDDEVTIYSVGLFPEANGYDAEKISYNVNANGNGSPAEGFFQNANCFLHLVSSNYPDATGVDEGARGVLSDKYEEGEKSYYLGTSDATQLAGIFEQISEDVTPGETTVTLDENSVVKDVIADNFQIVEGASSVTAWTESCTGRDENGNWTWRRDDGSGSALTVNVADDTLSVTGFDFAQILSTWWARRARVKSSWWRY